MPNITEKEFINYISKVDKPRHTKQPSIKVEKIYDSIPSTYWKEHGYKKITRELFSSILKEFGKVSIDFWLHGYDLIFPCKLGRLCLVDVHKKIYINKNNKVVSNMKIDWNTTMKLWYKDEGAFKNKTIIRFDTDKITTFNYNKSTAEYRNKQFYKVFIKRRLLNNILK